MITHRLPPLPWLAGLMLAGLCAVAPAAEAAPAATRTLERAHAHNDYAHPRPLLDALDHGFNSVEADVWLVDGRLLVAHDREQAVPERTLQALYLDPLRARARRNGGRVHPGGPSLILLIDVKSEAEPAYTALRAVLAEYAGMLTAFTGTNTVTNAVTVILSGNRATNVLAAEVTRLAALDGRLPDLERNASPHLVPLISDNWQKQFKWRGDGALPEAERRQLVRIVDQAHQQGRRVRFWAVPDNPAGWQALQAAGVDLINTDHLAGLRDFLSGKPR
jgi:glycerophosphoryl diester phosphodiesterase